MAIKYGQYIVSLPIIPTFYKLEINTREYVESLCAITDYLTKISRYL